MGLEICTLYILVLSIAPLYTIIFSAGLPGDSEGTFWSSRPATSCQMENSHCCVVQMLIFIVISLTRQGIEPAFTVSVAGALFNLLDR